MKLIISKFILVLLLTGQAVNSVWASPQLLHELEFPGFESKVLRFGNLDSSPDIEFVAVQSIGQKITWLGAYKLDGRQLWEVGKKNRGSAQVSFDLAVQVYDWNADGIDDVIFVYRSKLQVRNGLDGSIIKSMPLPTMRDVSRKDSTPRDAIFIAKLINNEKPSLLLKNRNQQFWIYDHNLKLHFQRKTSTGHFPTSADLNADGIEDLLIGYEAWDIANKKLLWQLPRFLPRKYHNDAIDIDAQHVALSTSKESILLSREGKLLFSIPHQHSQHAVLWADLVSYVDRGARTIYTYDKHGKLKWLLQAEGRLVMISELNHWQDEVLLLVTRREKSTNPIMINAAGEIVGEFSFASHTNQVFAQHFDFYGDSREEVIIYNDRKLSIFTNADPAGVLEVDHKLPNRRIYNASFYTGMQ